jgi:hypothetical protein
MKAPDTNILIFKMSSVVREIPQFYLNVIPQLGNFKTAREKAQSFLLQGHNHLQPSHMMYMHCKLVVHMENRDNVVPNNIK